jgi:hypothetical protein
MHNSNTCDMYMCRLRHIHDPVLSSLKMEGIRLFLTQALDRGQLHTSADILLVTAIRWSFARMLGKLLCRERERERRTDRQTYRQTDRQAKRFNVSFIVFRILLLFNDIHSCISHTCNTARVTRYCNNMRLNV